MADDTQRDFRDRPHRFRPRFLPKQQFVAEVLAKQADAGLLDELMHIRGSDTTDDLPFE